MIFSQALLHCYYVNKVNLFCIATLDLSFDGSEQTLTPIFQNQSLGWVEIEGYQLWVHFSVKRGMSCSRIKKKFCHRREVMSDRFHGYTRFTHQGKVGKKIIFSRSANLNYFRGMSEFCLTGYSQGKVRDF